MKPNEIAIDFDERPYIVIWEVTQACDLACVHCRASAQPKRNPSELSTEEGKRLIDEIAAMEVPVFVLTGGDPIKRPDLFELIEHAAKVGRESFADAQCYSTADARGRASIEAKRIGPAGGEPRWLERRSSRRVPRHVRLVPAHHGSHRMGE